MKRRCVVCGDTKDDAEFGATLGKRLGICLDCEKKKEAA